MANQTLTQLPIATSASTGDVFYIVTNYQSGSPTLTGDSKQIYFSAISNSISGTSISNVVNNGIITATGTTPKLRTEPNLTFDGSSLNVTGNTITSGSGTLGSFQVGSQLTGATATGVTMPIYISATKTTALTIPSAVSTILTNFSTTYSSATGSTWNATSGGFNVPKTAVYRITLTVTLNSFSANTGGELSIAYGLAQASPIDIISSTNTFGRQMTLFSITPLTAGQNVFFSVLNTTGTSLSLNTANGYNLLLIEEIPDIITD